MIKGGNVMQELLIDFGLASLLLLVGYFLRAKVSVFQKLYIPVAVIAGTLGLILGPNGLGKICGAYLPFSQVSATYANFLLAIVFTTICVGVKFGNTMLKNGFNYLMASSGLLIFQVILGYGCVKVLQVCGSAVLDGFAMLPSTGFYGGHGLGATVASAFETIGYWNTEEIISIATTFATVGLLYGIIFGIIFINIAARKGILQHAGTLDQLTKEELTGYVPEDKRKSSMKDVSMGTAIDAIAVQFAFVMVIVLGAFALNSIFSKIPYLSSLNLIATVAICAVAAGLLCSKTKLGKVMEPAGMKHISSTAMEFLIVFSMTNTNLAVIVTYGKEILVCTLVILLLDTVVCFVICKAWFKRDWFEHAINLFGTSTGVMATGLLLLHVADPENKSCAMLSLPLSTLTSIVTQTFCLCVAPIILVNAPGKLIGGLIAVLIVMCIAATVVANMVPDQA